MGINKTLEQKLETNGSIHWNPDVYSPPREFKHTSDWSPPPNYYKEEGNIFFMTQRWGMLPLHPEINCSQTYLFYSKCPFIQSITTIEVQEDIYIQLLRNGEIVFNCNYLNSFD